MNTFLDTFSMLFLLVIYFFIGISVIISIDFTYYAITKKSLLVIIENKLFGSIK
jgi:hypothetical protein